MAFIPADFARRMHEVHGQEKASAWLASLPAILARCAERWQLTIFPPFQNISFHYAAPARRADGTLVVIKASSPTGEFAEEAEALRLFQGESTVRLLEVDEECEVFLLERLLPGTLLASLVSEQDERATSILVSAMKHIWRPVPDRHSFPTVEHWAKGLARLRSQYQGSYGPFPPRLVQEAEALFTELCASAPTRMLLHGDLHHENVLQAGDTWRVIDPKGVIGDPGYETGVLFYNPMPYIFHIPNLRKVLARRVDQLAEELEMERARIRGWGLAQCVLSAWWSVENDATAEPPADVLACAEIMASMR
ncbi:MAG TPA: aminoglycoside phosphotransferase family protein [Ktedonobacteraceae bacterium]|nr:aminoglycoside phosphotransferase family protein [Ktedonobacteraceae bacterium]